MANKSWYEIQAKGDNSADIYIYSEIGYWGITARKFVSELRELGELDQITVHINSVGGEVGDGIAIYNTLKKHPAHVDVEIDGYCLSIATVISMAGDRRRMALNALYMIHNPWGWAVGDTAELHKQADVMEKHKNVIVTTYAQHTGIDAEELSQLMDDETWYEANEALAAGFIDEVTDAVDIEAAAKNLPKDFDPNKFRNCPRSFFKFTNPLAIANTNREETTMPEENKGKNTPEAQPEGSGTPVDEKQVQQQALNAEADRRKQIKAIFEPFNAEHRDLMDECLDNMEMSVEQAQARLLNAIGAQGPEPMGKEPAATAGETGKDRFRNDGVLALSVRSGVAKASDNKSNELRGYSLIEMARRSLEIVGVSTSGMDKMAIVGAAFTHSSSDFPVILENTMHKVLLDAYTNAPDTWRNWCAVGEVSDFRAHSRITMGSFSNLDKVKENGEYKYKDIPDGKKESVIADTAGNLVSLNRKMIINDDLDAFTRIPRMLGRAGKRSIESDAYALLVSNPVMADGVALFHADHNNLAAGAGINTATVDTSRVLMAEQKDISGNDVLDLRPAIFLTPTALGGTARVTMSSEFEVGASSKNNTVSNSVRDLATVIDTARLTGNGWYLFADPNDEPVIEVSFLDGNEEPFLDMEESFTVDGATYKVRLDYGVGAVGYKGAVKNPGA